MKSVIQRYWPIATIAALIVALDQWTKWLVRANIPQGGTWLPESLEWLSPYARIVHWYNTGAAFGMFQNASMVFTVLAFIVIAAIIYYYPHVENTDWSLRLAMSMQLGGAIGNLIDRHIGAGDRFYIHRLFSGLQCCRCKYQCWCCSFIAGGLAYGKVREKRKSECSGL